MIGLELRWLNGRAYTTVPVSSCTLCRISMRLIGCPCQVHMTPTERVALESLKRDLANAIALDTSAAIAEYARERNDSADLEPTAMRAGPELEVTRA